MILYSISGRWMSSTQMEQDFASKPDLTPSTMKVKVPQVHLFLPESVICLFVTVQITNSDESSTDIIT